MTHSRIDDEGSLESVAGSCYLQRAAVSFVPSVPSNVEFACSDSFAESVSFVVGSTELLALDAWPASTLTGAPA